MDGPRQLPERDADRSTPAIEGASDLPIYIFALIATVALTVGFFAWVKIDPAVPPPMVPARESRNEFPNCHSQSAAYAICVPANDLIDDQPMGLISLRG